MGSLYNSFATSQKLTWHNSPNVHFLSLKDFDQFCAKSGITIEKGIPLVKKSAAPVTFARNLFAEQAIYVTSRA